MFETDTQTGFAHYFEQDVPGNCEKMRNPAIDLEGPYQPIGTIAKDLAD